MKTIESLARIIFTTGKADLTESGFEFRKGKSVSDINHAIVKSRKAGRGKLEFELSMMEVYLKEVIKPVRVAKSSALKP